MRHRNLLVVMTSFIVVVFITGELLAQRGPGRGRGRGRGKGGPGFRGGRQDPTFEADHKVFHFLLANGKNIRRQVKNLKNGIETTTESDNPQIAAKIQEHVAAMYNRLETKRPIHMRDPLFRELFKHTDKINMKLKRTEKGIHVVETSKDPYVARLLQEHAKVVSLFIENGHVEAHKNHAVPPQKGIAAAPQADKAAAKQTCCMGKCKDGNKACKQCKDGKACQECKEGNKASKQRKDGT